jgi:chromosome segregation and condensation protein ScpB
VSDGPDPDIVVVEPELDPDRLRELERIVEALLFLSPEAVTAVGLAGAAEAEIDEIRAALTALEGHYASGNRGLVIRQAAGGWSLASHPDAEDAARNLLARPRTPPRDHRLPAAGLTAGDSPDPWR